MGIPLFAHNQKAYEEAISMLEETGKAAVVHPTGTGKSFIGFKLAEEHPASIICWLSPSEYIYKTQVENLKAAGGCELPNIKFFTYAKLMAMGDEMEEINPSYIVLDEFHRCGAKMWGQGVQRLLAMYPSAPILGLSATNIRYLDGQRDMADELFDGNIASEMTLGEAIVRGILNAPTYVLSVYGYQKDLEKYQTKVRRAKNRAVQDEAEKYLEALRRALDKADGLDKIFDKYMEDRSGKYIVFCANIDHMLEMQGYVPEWFGRVDAHPHVYSVYTDNPETSSEFTAFKEDESAHLKLLFCIDMLNEGIHVDGISGVVLLRPTVSPIVYKQQIGRAFLAGGKKSSVIFDVAMNIENLYSIDTMQQEMQEAARYYFPTGEHKQIVTERFRIYDELRDCRELFGKLKDTLAAPWDVMYGCAKRYYREYGDLAVPRRYKTKEHYSLGNWIFTQRKIRAGEQYGALDGERIRKLDEIGMLWGNTRDAAWQRNYQEAKKWYQQHGNLNVPAKTVTDTGFRLGIWLSNLRTYYKNNTQGAYLTPERIAALEEIGMVWDVSDHIWERNFAAASHYYDEYGNLDVRADYQTEDGIRLGVWIASLRNIKSGNDNTSSLSDEQIKRLESIGMQWNSVFTRKWEEAYAEARAYWMQHGDLKPPAKFTTTSGFCLGKWIRRQRENKEKLDPKQVEKLEAIGMEWKKADPWEASYAAAKKYYEQNGNLQVPSGCVVEGVWLQKWLNEQKKAYRCKSQSKGQTAGRGKNSDGEQAAGRGKNSDGEQTARCGKNSGRGLTAERIKRLEDIGMVWKTSAELSWETQYGDALEFFKDNGHLDVPNGYKTKSRKDLPAWLMVQRRKFREGKLTENQVRLLEETGMDWGQNNTWQGGYAHAQEYFKTHGSLDIPDEYVCRDGYQLKGWVARQRKAYQSGTLPKEREQALESIGMVWYLQDESWNNCLDAIYETYQKTGKWEVPHDIKIEGCDCDLNSWIATQRKKHRIGTLSEEKIRKLDLIGFEWRTPNEVKWDQHFQSALKYQQEHGNLDIPATWRDETGFYLKKWLVTQKQKLEDGKLGKGQEERLRGLVCE